MDGYQEARCSRSCSYQIKTLQLETINRTTFAAVHVVAESQDDLKGERINVSYRRDLIATSCKSSDNKYWGM